MPTGDRHCDKLHKLGGSYHDVLPGHDGLVKHSQDLIDGFDSIEYGLGPD